MLSSTVFPGLPPDLRYLNGRRPGNQEIITQGYFGIIADRTHNFFIFQAQVCAEVAELLPVFLFGKGLERPLVDGQTLDAEECRPARR